MFDKLNAGTRQTSEVWIGVRYQRGGVENNDNVVEDVDDAVACNYVSLSNNWPMCMTVIYNGAAPERVSTGQRQKQCH